MSALRGGRGASRGGRPSRAKAKAEEPVILTLSSDDEDEKSGGTKESKVIISFFACLN